LAQGISEFSQNYGHCSEEYTMLNNEGHYIGLPYINISQGEGILPTYRHKKVGYINEKLA